MRESEQNLLQKLVDDFEFSIKQHPKLFLRSMTHRSYANEQDLEYDNERMEFLGDAIIDLIVCEHLFREYPEYREGRLSEIKSAVVNTSALTRIARQLNLEGYLRLSKGETRTLRGRDKVIADSFEAFVGAVYLSGGLEETREFVMPYFDQEINRYLEQGTRNYKGKLLEWTQDLGIPNPEYHLDKVEGPQHDPHHTVTVFVNGSPRGTGEGRTKKDAEQEAAREALEVLTDDED